MEYKITLREFVEKYYDADHWAYLLGSWHPDGWHPDDQYDDKRYAARMFVPEAKRHLIEQFGHFTLYSMFYDLVHQRIYIDVLFRDENTGQAINIFTMESETTYVLITDIIVPAPLAARFALERL
ncbi:MAG: hypothetical protein ACTSPB_24805 [Candidatus Thorarchaeota archaeon]